MSNDWWHRETLRQRIAWKRDTDELVAARSAAWREGVAPDSAGARELAARHVAWLRQIPGTPVAGTDRERGAELLRVLGRLYVRDPCFSATYRAPRPRLSFATPSTSTPGVLWKGLPVGGRLGAFRRAFTGRARAPPRGAGEWAAPRGEDRQTWLRRSPGSSGRASSGWRSAAS